MTNRFFDETNFPFVAMPKTKRISIKPRNGITALIISGLNIFFIFLDAKAPMILNRNFKPGFRINLHIKDLQNALNAGHNANACLPLTAQVMEFMQVLKADGKGELDHSALANYYEKLYGLEIKK